MLPPMGMSPPGAGFAGANIMNTLLGYSFMASLLQNTTGSPFLNSIRLFIMSTLFEMVRRFWTFLTGRFKLRYSISAFFSEGDPAYEWMILFLTEEKVWQQSCDFRVTASSSMRTWGVSMDPSSGLTDKEVNHADYIPIYEAPRLFWWGGYWMDIKRNRSVTSPGMGMPSSPSGSIHLTIYTRNTNVLSKVVEEARRRYVAVSQPHVTVYQANSAVSPGLGSSSVWNSAKRKRRRPLNSVILQDGLINSLVKDARTFLRAEAWYSKAGIPHRRGYLLYGPPGTGKTSTIYSIAGELNLEIYSLSLAASFVDDGYLQRAVNSIPKKAIFLLEDIDCAFPSRDPDEDDDDLAAPGRPLPFTGLPYSARRDPMAMGRSRVTLSGLLNVLDGVGSEEGKLFFATTNFIDNLDSALMRPGRIDRKVKYRLASKGQAAALFIRFFPADDLEEGAADAEEEDELYSDSPAVIEEVEKKVIRPIVTLADVERLSKEFAGCIPEDEVSTAELQGFLLGWRRDPIGAAEHAKEWVDALREERRQKAEREAERKAKAKAKKATKEALKLQGSLAKLTEIQEKAKKDDEEVPTTTSTTSTPPAEETKPVDGPTTTTEKPDSDPSDLKKMDKLTRMRLPLMKEAAQQELDTPAQTLPPSPDSV